MICTEIMLIRDKCAIQRNNMRRLVVTVQQSKMCILTLITLIIFVKNDIKHYDDMNLWVCYKKRKFHDSTVVASVQCQRPTEHSTENYWFISSVTRHYSCSSSSQTEGKSRKKEEKVIKSRKK